MADPNGQVAKTSQSGEDLTGSTVGRFAVRVRLGGGGMGEVYRADDTKLKRPVALKRMAPELRADERYRRRFLHEGERASALNDAHIAAVYDVLEQDGELFLVMEHVEGRTLRTCLRDKPPSVPELVPIATQCAEALVAAAKKRIVHHDIKPENIMLTPTGQAKILDFGVAKRLMKDDEGTTTTSTESTIGGLSGTVAYMAPEVLLQREPDTRSDIFSLGVVLYEALTGQHPFRAESFVATSDRILHELPVPPTRLNPRVPAELERIANKMLAKDPEERYATAADLVVDLRALERTLHPGVRPVSAVVRKLPWPRQILLIAVAVAVMVSGLWWVLAPSPPVERARVAVLPFANQTEEEDLERVRLMLTHMLLLDLTASPNIKVFSYERLLEITQGFEAEGKDFSSPEAVQAVADYSNAQFVVVPAMHAIGNTMRVSAEFRDAGTGEIIGVTQAERSRSGSAEDTLYSMLGELADGIQRQFKGLGRGKEYQVPPAGQRPKTAAAAIHLNEGQNAFAQGDYGRALDSFQQVVEEDPWFALAHAWMGQVYGLLGHDDRALEVSEQAARLITPQTPINDAYFIEANLAERRYDFSAAEQKYLELIRLYPDDPVWHYHLARIYGQRGLYPKALSSYQEALSRDSKYVVAYQHLGTFYSRTGDYAAALSHTQKALTLYRALRNREGEARALLDLANIFRLRRNIQEAKSSAELALQLFTSLENQFGVLEATKRLGDAYFSEGELKQARQYYEHVLAASSEPLNNRLVALTMMNLGVTYHREGNLAKATEYYERSLAQQQAHGEYKDWPALRERALALSNLSVLRIEYGPDPDRASQLAEEALAIHQMMGDKSWEAQDHNSLGLYDMNSGRYGQAIEHFQQARRLARSVGENVQELGFSTYNLGRCYFFHNQYEQGLESVRNALRVFEGLEDPFDVALSQILLGWIYHRLGDTDQARPLLEEGLQAAIDKGYGELLPDAYAALGELYLETGERERAKQSWERGSALWKEPAVSESTVEARSNLGIMVAEEGNLDRGLSYSRASAARARQLQHRHTLARTLINLAGVHLLRKEYSEAKEVLEELTSLDERELGLELRAQAFHLQGRAYAGLGKIGEAEASYRQGQEAIRKLQSGLDPGHRESFAARREVKVLIP